MRSRDPVVFSVFCGSAPPPKRWCVGPMARVRSVTPEKEWMELVPSGIASKGSCD